jgi:hypothetical protein
VQDFIIYFKGYIKNRMATVAYLFGAGASAQCIPVVQGRGEDLMSTIEEVAAFFYEQKFRHRIT